MFNNFKKYQPSEEILHKYADLMVNFGANNGNGIKKGDTVLLKVPVIAKDFLLPLQQAVLKAGGYPMMELLPDDSVTANFYEYADDKQLEFFPKKYLQAKIEQVDHVINVLAEDSPSFLEKIDKQKQLKRIKKFKPYKDLLEEQEAKGKYSWTLCLYGTASMAKKSQMSLKEYWEQIIKACYLDSENPVKTWQEKRRKIFKIREKLDSLEIQKIFVKSENIDLEVEIGRSRKWLGCSGRNIPSFEIFTSPNWKGVEGRIKFDQPVEIFNKMVENVELEFYKGRVVKYYASKNQDILDEIFKIKNADKIGEFSLTDKDFSRIDVFMSQTLYDENRGGEYGNMHIALGNSYKDSYPGADKPSLTNKDWEDLGYNQSLIHIDIVNTEPKVVTALLKNGKKKVIYKNGKFLV